MALAVLGHLALLAGAGAQRHHVAEANAAAPAAAPVALSVLLLPANVTLAQAPRPVALPPAAPPPPRRPPQATMPLAQATPELQAPVVADGLEAGRLLLLPGLAASNPIAHFWIDAQGAVERVEIDNHPYNEEEAGRVLAALQLVRFEPARLEGVAVAGELAVTLMVASEIGM